MPIISRIELPKQYKFIVQGTAGERCATLHICASSAQEATTKWCMTFDPEVRAGMVPIASNLDEMYFLGHLWQGHGFQELGN